MKQRDFLRLFYISAIVLFLLSGSDSQSQAADVYKIQIQPFMQKYCIACHNSKKTKGELNLTRYSRAAEVAGSFRRWTNIIKFIRKAEMPPKDTKQPSLKERKAVVAVLRNILLAESKKNAGDPGLVLSRRLSRTEFDLSVRDLTGIDIKPTKKFPPDPAAGEGFNNTGEALAMSPSLLKKYLFAAQQVSNHLVLKTNGITFANFPVTSYNERKKLTEQAIIDFYKQHEVRIPDYLEAAWRYRHRSNADRNVSISVWAKRHQLSGKYLSLVWKTLNKASSTSGYLKRLGKMWESIPKLSGNSETPAELARLNQFIEFCKPTFPRWLEPGTDPSSERRPF